MLYSKRRTALTRITILFHDDHLVAIDKPSGILSVQDRYDPDAPVARTMLEPEWGKLLVVHRIDKDTSGVILYARNSEAHKHLCESFETRKVEKLYIGLVKGVPEWEETECSLPLLPDGDRLHRTIIDKQAGKPSTTSFRVVSRFKGVTLIEARPSSGRRHQIRVHLQALGYPCLCDPLYSTGKPFMLSSYKRGWSGDRAEERPLLSRTALHAMKAVFEHTFTHEMLEISADLPRDLKATITQLSRMPI